MDPAFGSPASRSSPLMASSVPAGSSPAAPAGMGGRGRRNLFRSPAPCEAGGLDWFAGMEEDDVDGNRMLLSDPEAARAKMDKDRDQALATAASGLARALESFLSPADAAVMDGQMAEYLTYCDHEGLAPGSQGWWDDARAHVRPWG